MYLHFNCLGWKNIKIILIENVDCKDKYELLKKEDFYDSLRMEKCSDENYKHYLNVMDKFKFKSFEEYHDAYLYSDVLLLADFYETYRNT